MNTEKMSHVVSMTANVGVLIGLSLLVHELNQNNRHLEEQADTWAVERRVTGANMVGTNSDVARLIYPHLTEQSLSPLDE